MTTTTKALLTNRGIAGPAQAWALKRGRFRCHLAGTSARWIMTSHGEDPCRIHVRRYLQAPFLADQARKGEHDEASYADDVITPGVPPTLRHVLEHWAADESTPDEEIAQFIGWPVQLVREHR